MDYLDLLDEKEADLPSTAAPRPMQPSLHTSIRTSITRPAALLTSIPNSDLQPESPRSAGTPRRRTAAAEASRRSAAPARRTPRTPPVIPAAARQITGQVNNQVRDDAKDAVGVMRNVQDEIKERQEEFKVESVGNNNGDYVYRIYGRSVFKGLASYLNSQFLSDLDIIAPEVSSPIRAHKAVVCAQSKYFQAILLDSNEAESKTSSIVNLSLKGRYKTEHIIKAIEFLYTGKVALNDSTVIDFFMLSCELGINELKRFCEDHIGTAISPRSCLELLQSSKFHDSTELQKRCLQYFKQNANDIIKLYTNNVSESDEAEKIKVLRSISEDTMIDILVKNFKCKEVEVLKFVLEWGVAQKGKDENQQIAQIIADVIPYVRLVSLSRKQLEEFLLPMNVVPKKMLVEVCFRKLNFQYSFPATEEKMSEDRRAREPDGTPRKFYLRPRLKNWLTLEDFEHEGQYAEYCKSVLAPGMLMRAVRSYENVLEGDIGEFVQHNSGYPPCQINWRNYGNTYWLYWRDLEIID